MTTKAQEDIAARYKLGTLNRIGLDMENNGEEWWSAARADFATWDVSSCSPQVVAAVRSLLFDSAVESVDVEYEVAAEVLRWAASLPGWEGGPKYAPHPLYVTPLS